MSVDMQVCWLFILAIPVACISWTITHEEIFYEPRKFLYDLSRRKDRNLLVRKFCYVFTCEYCFSHYVSITAVAVADFYLLVRDWRGYLAAVFSLVWIANVYMSLYALLRQSIKKEKTEIKVLEETNELDED
ncbi:MAG TPA: hypothetical protein VI112_08105 [Bacteroidia bacterium]